MELRSISINLTHLHHMSTALRLNPVAWIQWIRNPGGNELRRFRRINVLHVELVVRNIRYPVLLQLLGLGLLDITHVHIVSPFQAPVFPVGIGDRPCDIRGVQFIVGETVFHCICLGLHQHRQAALPKLITSAGDWPPDMPFEDVVFIFRRLVHRLTKLLIAFITHAIFNITDMIFGSCSSIVLP